MTERHALLTLWESGFEWVPVEPFAYADVHVAGAPTRTYAARCWTSPVVELPFAATELIPSWNARTPSGSWLLVEGRVADGDGWTPWFVFARWAEADPAWGAPVTRTTVPGQVHEAGRVATDTWVSAEGRSFDRWQVRVTGLAPEGDDSFPSVSLVSGAASAMSITPGEPTSSPTLPAAVEVPVPAHSQRLHADTFPEWDRGGQSWCSPTSTTMLLEHWGVAPTPDETAWVGHDTDPQVVHGVRMVFDRAYGGAGNWAFNAAYAASCGLRAYVTRLRDLTEAECLVSAGIPLVVSVSFRREELDGAGYDTNGHLLTVVGFTASGDVVSNDPASHLVASNEQVRVVYRRDQFERVWLGGNGGLAYVLHRPDVSLPPAPAEANWG